MKLAIEAMQMHVAGLEVQLEQARAAAAGLKTQHDGALERANQYVAAIADCRAAIAALEVQPPPAAERPALVVDTKARAKK